MIKTTNDPKSAAQKNREQLQNQRKDFQERNRRSHRLIVKGAIIESMYPQTLTMSDDEFRDFLLRGNNLDAMREDEVGEELPW
jgi:lipid II:glycine glycyltransferase (peptidoglycan interpeptide bridge formation enzyme)